MHIEGGIRPVDVRPILRAKIQAQQKAEDVIKENQNLKKDLVSLWLIFIKTLHSIFMKFS